MHTEELKGVKSWIVKKISEAPKKCINSHTLFRSVMSKFQASALDASFYITHFITNDRILIAHFDKDGNQIIELGSFSDEEVRTYCLELFKRTTGVEYH